MDLDDEKKQKLAWEDSLAFIRTLMVTSLCLPIPPRVSLS